jgi:hypothetical protein
VNKAVFLFTLFIRFTQLSSLASLLFVAIILPALLSTICLDKEAVEPIAEGFKSPFLPILIASMFVRDGVANWKAGKDGEYLALLFTRPLLRSQYVITKWLAGSILVFAIITVQICAFAAVQQAYGHLSAGLIDLYTFANLALNSFSLTALVVLIACVPLRLGVWLFLLLYYVAIFGSAVAQISLKQSDQPDTFAIFCQAVLWLMQTVGNFAFPSIDLFDVLNAQNFSWLPIIGYFTNISLYLLIATIILSKREFFYATD